MRIAERIAAGLSTAALVVQLAAACSAGVSRPCSDIPVDGCPLDRGGTCEDPECAALYACYDGRWSLHERCEQGAGGDGGGGAAGGGAGAGGCAGVTIDHQGETIGCLPELQLPDCPAAIAESCQPCITGCGDFFLCTEEGWHLVAFCSEEGNVVEVQ